MHEQAIQHYFADKEPMLVEAVSRLVRIDSTLGPALPGKPFGEGPAAALEELRGLAQGQGCAPDELAGVLFSMYAMPPGPCCSCFALRRGRGAQIGRAHV